MSPLPSPSYRWIDRWLTIPDVPLGRENGRTHGLAYSRTRDRVIVFHQSDPAVLVCTPDGRVESAWGNRFQGAHGLTIVEENGREFLWLVDEKSTEVVKTTLTGDTVLTIQRPDHPAYRGEGPRARYVPTWATQNPLNGDVWVGDGYGSHLVHRYDARGRYLQTIDGTEGAGRFAEPHGLNFARTASGGVELFVTDRSNHRIVVYDGEGRFLRSSLSAHSPCCFDFLGEHVLVPELFTGVKVLDLATLAVVCEIGANPNVAPNPTGAWWPPVAPAGWPNLAGTDAVQPGRFNSPHGACFGPSGDIYVGEWIIGGRLTKLVRES